MAVKAARDLKAVASLLIVVLVSRVVVIIVIIIVHLIVVVGVTIPVLVLKVGDAIVVIALAIAIGNTVDGEIVIEVQSSRPSVKPPRPAPLLVGVVVSLSYGRYLCTQKQTTNAQLFVHTMNTRKSLTPHNSMKTLAIGTSFDCTLQP